MEWKRWIVLLVLVFISAMPLKIGSMTKNDITPAPPIPYISNMFIHGEKDNDIFARESKYISPMVQENMKTQKPTDSHKSIQILPEETKHVKKFHARSKLKNPICFYGFREIFLLHNSCPLHEDEMYDNSIVTPPEVKPKLVASGFEQTVPNQTIPTSGNGQQTKETSWQNSETIADEEKKVGDIQSLNLELLDGKETIDADADSMQSFEEWKSKKLQEQEERKAEELLAPAVHVVRAKKTQVNYASQDCGAKILGHNKEAKHVSAILDENRDLYMLNPCSTSIWFIIELCEPIQVQQLQLWNLELFSSAPKDFSVSISERYPAREWHSIGTFQAKNDRTLQTFSPNSDETMFAKYIKFEMLNHFSNEHFCPLTLVRVLGVSMVDEFDEEGEPSSNKEDIAEEIPSELSPQDVHKAEEGAINTMINMVKNAMGHVLNNNGAETKDSVSEHSIANKSDLSDDQELGMNDSETADPSLESDLVLVLNETEVAPVTTVNKTDRFITLVQTGNGEEISEYLKNLTYSQSKKIPLVVPKFIMLFTPLNIDMCWFLEFFCKVSLAGCLVHYPYDHSTLGLFVPLTSYSGTDILASSTNVSSKDSKPSEISPSPDQEIQYSNEDAILNSIEIQENIQATAHQESNATENESANDDSPSSSSSVQKHSTEEPINSTPDTNKDSKHIQQKANCNIPNNDAEVPLKDVDFFVIEKSIVDEDTIPSTESKPEDRESDISVQLEEIESNGAQNGSLENDSNNETGGNMIQGVSHGKMESDNNISSPMMVDKIVNINSTNKLSDIASVTNGTQSNPTVVINPGTNQKDSVFMRLSNRIRVLEQNMSLSSDYLETLSQRYKKQMDEMLRASNQTSSKLNTMDRTLEDNDAKQAEQLLRVQAEVEMLTLQLQNLSLSHDQLNHQLVERHVCLILLEIAIFVAALVTCVGRRMMQLQKNIQKTEVLIEELQNALKGTKDSNLSILQQNGHCTSIPCVEKEACSVVLRTKSKKKKNRHISKTFKLNEKSPSKEGKENNSRNNLETCKNCAPQPVELIDKDPRWSMNDHTCNGIGEAGWEVHPISLKISNVHGKGRK